MTEQEAIAKHPDVMNWVLWTKAKGFCMQCQRPWNDGLCECGGHPFGKEEERRIARLVISMMEEEEKK